MPTAVTPQQASQSPSDSSSRRVVPKVRVSCWRRPGVVSDGTRMVTSTSDLAMSRPATRCTNSGSSCTSCIGGSYDERAVAGAVVRRSQGQAGNLVRGLEAPFSGPEGWLPASDSYTGSGPPSKDDVSERPRHTLSNHLAPAREHPPALVCPNNSATAPGAAGLPCNGGSAAQIFTP